MARLVAGKSASRRRKAKMPFPRKVEIVVSLQEIATAACRATGRKPAGTPWRLFRRNENS